MILKNCSYCGKKLTQYNPGELCFPCQEKKQEELETKIEDSPNYNVSDMQRILGLDSAEQVKRLSRAGKIPGRVPEIRQHLWKKEVVNDWIQTGGKLPEKVAPKEQGELERLKRQQMEHIGTLQNLARSTVDGLPELPDLDDVNEFDVFYFSLAKLFLRLTGDIHWLDLAAHLGEKAQEISDMSYKLDPYILPHWRRGLPVPDNDKKNAREGWELIITSGLQSVADSGDTRKWEWEGLNQRCQNCPDQEYEPVEITPEDFTSSRFFPEMKLSDFQDHGDDNSSTDK